MKKIYWAGIGSRETPQELKQLIKKITEELNAKGFILRSGGAPGADYFFEIASIPEQREIYLPWKGFNGNESELYGVTFGALNLAEKYHPYWKNLSLGAKKLMARNCYQVLGQDLKTPVSFVVCWTKDGKASGGTGQAIRIANDLQIPVFNLKLDGEYEALMHYINKLESESTSLTQDLV